MATGDRFGRTISWLVGSATILIAAQTHAARPDVRAEARGSCLVLEWIDPHQLLPVGERWMAKETTRILGEADIPARWDWSPDDEPRSPRGREHRLRVVLLPSEPSGPGWGLAMNTLGATVMNGATAPPAVYIFYRSVVSLLSRRGRTLGSSDPYSMGPASRALGRVVAHEVAHALAPDEPHASSGLMQAGLAPELLIERNDVAIDDHWEQVLGAGLSELCSAR